jgi:hypothetical protein
MARRFKFKHLGLIFSLLIFSAQAQVASNAMPAAAPRLSGEKLKRFNELRVAVRQLLDEELKAKIGRQPERRNELINEYNKFYKEIIYDLMNNYALDNVDIIKDWTFPGITGQSPSGSGMQWGDVAVWGLYTPKDLYSGMSDAAAGFGFGLGNPNRYVGISAGMDFQDLYDSRGGKRYDITRLPDFSIGALSVSLHRNLPASIAVGVAFNNVAEYGYEREIAFRKSQHLAVTKYFVTGHSGQWFSVHQFTAGMGRGGTYVDDKTFIAKRADIASEYGPFFSLGTRVHGPLGIGVDYQRKQIGAFINLAPFRNFPLTMSFLGINLNKYAGFDRMVYVSVGLAYNFAKVKRSDE